MRHFLRVTLAPGALTRRVFTRSAVAFLVAFRGAAQRFTPANLRAALRTVAVAAVAICADAHLLRTTRAAIQPITLFACPHEPGTRHWTTPRTAGGHKGKGNAAFIRARPQKARGSFQEWPGPSSIRRLDVEHSGLRHRSTPHAQRIAHIAMRDFNRQCLVQSERTTRHAHDRTPSALYAPEER
jgi:hypothetical protein